MKIRILAVFLTCSACTLHIAGSSWVSKLKNALTGAKRSYEKQAPVSEKQEELFNLLKDDVLTAQEIKGMLTSGTFLTSAQKKLLKQDNIEAFKLYKKLYEEVAAAATIDYLDAFQGP